MLELIEKKQRGEELTAEEIARLIADFESGSVPDYQMAALLMAICFKGLSDKEIVSLTRALLESGDRWELSAKFHPVLDKHSTGGVGDKTSLLMVPMLAAAGYKVPKMSGRGLAHTGGTIDKLESIPGFRAELSREDALRQLEDIGCVIMSQSEGLVPAEKKLYALRDVTGTVSQPGLIISSILSKKLASGATHIIIDVKYGNGAFFASRADAEAFAKTLVTISHSFEPEFAAAVTDMNQPLGSAVGNALEVAEALHIVNERDVECEISALCITLGGALLKLAGEVESAKQGKDILAQTITDGRAADKLRALINAQGGDLDVFNREMNSIDRKACKVAITARSSGVIAGLNALAIGQFCHRQGAGRTRKGEAVNPWVGVVLHKKTGDKVASGDLLAEAYARLDCDESSVEEEVRSAYIIGESATAPRLIDTIVTS
jgi:pyrimidine-nucleoside phosphorylase